MLISSCLGFFHPDQMGSSLSEWRKGTIKTEDVFKTGQKVRRENWLLQQSLGINHIPSNDFSLTDPIYDMACLLGTIKHDDELIHYFSTEAERQHRFDTDEHFAVPRLSKDQNFSVSCNKIFDEFNEAKALGIITRPVLIGPLTFLLQAKPEQGDDFAPIALWPKILPVYVDILKRLEQIGAEWIQIDEPVLTRDQPGDILDLASILYAEMTAAIDSKILLAPYFGGLGENLKKVMCLPVKAVHIDLISDLDQYTEILDNDQGKIFSLGVIDGQGGRPPNLTAQLKFVERSVNQIGLRRTMAAPHCPLRYYRNEGGETPEQKLAHIAVMAKAMNIGKASIQKDIEKNQQALAQFTDLPRG